MYGTGLCERTSGRTSAQSSKRSTHNSGREMRSGQLIERMKPSVSLSEKSYFVGLYAGLARERDKTGLGTSEVPRFACMCVRWRFRVHVCVESRVAMVGKMGAGGKVRIQRLDEECGLTYAPSISNVLLCTWSNHSAIRFYRSATRAVLLAHSSPAAV